MNKVCGKIPCDKLNICLSNDFEDREKNTGWILGDLLSGRRYGVIESLEINLIDVYKKPGKKIIGEIGIGNLVKLNKCRKNWCFISIDNYKGWIEKKYIWGVFQNENFD